MTHTHSFLTLIPLRKLGSLILMLVSLLAFSCAPKLTVRTDYDHSVDFSHYKTFSLYNYLTIGTVSPLDAERMMQAIRTEMTKKGFTENDSHPDLVVNAATVLQDKLTVSANTQYYGGLYRPYGFWGAPRAGYTDVEAHAYKEGTVVIDLVDARTEKLVWTGTGQADIDKRPKNPEKAIHKVVAKIMEDFPGGNVQ